MKSNDLLLEINDHGLATIILNRTSTHNAFNGELINALSEAIRFCSQEENVRVIVLTSNGKTFSAGADLNWMRDSMAMSHQDNVNDAKRFAELLSLFKNCVKPTIAKINGPAYGGAIGIICCCDIAIASENSKFCFSEVKLGLIPATISPYVIAAIGEKAAKRYFVTAEDILPDKAKEIGLVDEVLPSSEVDDYCNTLVNKILANKPIAVNQAKQLVKTIALLNDTDEIIDITAQLIADIRITSEAQQALSEFLNKTNKSSPK